MGPGLLDLGTGVAAASALAGAMTALPKTAMPVFTGDKVMKGKLELHGHCCGSFTQDEGK